MKTYLFILVMGVSPLLLFSQSNKTVKDFFQKYKNDDRAEHFRIGGLLLDVAVSFSDDNAEKKILKKMKRLRLLAFDDANPVSSSDYQSLMKGINADNYSPLIKFREKGQSVDIFVQENNNRISELLLIVRGNKEFILLNFEGNFRFEDLNDFDLDTKGGDHLRRLPEKRADLPKA